MQLCTRWSHRGWAEKQILIFLTSWPLLPRKETWRAVQGFDLELICQLFVFRKSNLLSNVSLLRSFNHFDGICCRYVKWIINHIKWVCVICKSGISEMRFDPGSTAGGSLCFVCAWFYLDIKKKPSFISCLKKLESLKVPFSTI